MLRALTTVRRALNVRQARGHSATLPRVGKPQRSVCARRIAASRRAQAAAGPLPVANSCARRVSEGLAHRSQARRAFTFRRHQRRAPARKSAGRGGGTARGAGSPSRGVVRPTRTQAAQSEAGHGRASRCEPTHLFFRNDTFGSLTSNLSETPRSSIPPASSCCDTWRCACAPALPSIAAQPGPLGR